MEEMFDMDTVFEYIGYAAGLATVIAFAIQTVRILKSKSVTGLSSYMYIMYSLSLICWSAFGVYIESWVLAGSMAVTFLFTFVILLLILYYDEEDKIERYRKDSLTGIYNRKYFEEAVPVKIAESVVAKKPFSIIMASISNLDKIHKEMGGKYQGRALKLTAKALEKALRDSDFIARFDDNKFAVFLDNADEKTAKSVFKRVLDSINGIEIKKDDKLVEKIGLLVGICSSKYATDLTDLEDKSNKALQGAVYKGQNMVRVYEEEKSSEPEKTKKKEPARKSKK